MIVSELGRTVSPRACIRWLGRSLDANPQYVLIRLGLLAQGLLDEAFERWQLDTDDAWTRLVLSPVREVACAVVGDRALTPVERWQTLAALSALRRQLLPTTIQLEPLADEQDAVHPYVREAKQLKRLKGPWAVIGLRGPGVWLGAAVSAVLGNAHFVTVRLTTTPTAHRMHLSLALGETLRRFRRFAVVAAHPQTAAGAWGCVAEWFERAGVSSTRIHFLPAEVPARSHALTEGSFTPAGAATGG